eukprot:SAG31_NODE_20363_length_576_cov_2.740042_1_plen_47_part_10
MHVLRRSSYHGAVATPLKSNINRYLYFLKNSFKGIIKDRRGSYHVVP